MEYSAVEVVSFNVAAPLSGTKLATRAARDPGPGEVQVKMTLAPINPSDVFSLMGVYPKMGTALPGVPGFDGVGVVEKLGEGVTGLTVGQRVTARPWAADESNGSWQQYTTVAAKRLIPVPDAVSDQAAAQFYINPVTVIGLLEASKVPKGGYLIVTAAGSTLSKMLLATAKHQGIKTIGIVRRAEQMEEILAAGATEAVCSATEDLVARVKEITGGEGAHAAVDSIAGEMCQKLGDALRPNSPVIIYGMMGDTKFTGSAIACLFNYVTYQGFWLEPWLKSLSEEHQADVMKRTMDALEEGVMTPDIGKVFPLAQYKEAVEESLRVARGGKVLLSLE